MTANIFSGVFHNMTSFLFFFKGPISSSPASMTSDFFHWRESNIMKESNKSSDNGISSTTQLPLYQSPSSHHYSTESDRFQEAHHSSPLRSDMGDFEFVSPDSSSSLSNDKDNAKKSLRRSGRIAMLGKLVKPWPLKKSFSHNVVLDRNKADRSHDLARPGLLHKRLHDHQVPLDQDLHNSDNPVNRLKSAFRRVDTVSNSGDYHRSSLDKGNTVRHRHARKYLDFSGAEDLEEEEDTTLKNISSKRQQMKRSSQFASKGKKKKKKKLLS